MGASWVEGSGAVLVSGMGRTTWRVQLVLGLGLTTGRKCLFPFGRGCVGEGETSLTRLSRGGSIEASGSPLETGIGSGDYVDESAENGTRYYYIVTAVAGEGDESAESDPSNKVQKTPFSDPPDRP